LKGDELIARQLVVFAHVTDSDSWDKKSLIPEKILIEPAYLKLQSKRNQAASVSSMSEIKDFWLNENVNDEEIRIAFEKLKLQLLEKFSKADYSAIKVIEKLEREKDQDDGWD